MSIRNNNNASSWLEQATAGTNLPALTSAYTVMIWVYTVTTAVRSVIWGMRANDATIRIGNGNLSSENLNDFMLWANASYDVYTSAAVTLNAWYHLAVAQSAANARTMWVHDTAGSLIWTLNSTATVTGTLDAWLLLADSQMSYWHNGRIAAVKVWTTNLTLAQVQAERAFANPQLLTNFWGGWALQTVASRNTFIGGGSGTPGTWAVNGAQLIDEADPPITFDQVTWDQAGFRWRDDNGSETTASYLAAQNTNITRAAGLPTRLRMLVDSNDLDPGAEALQWEYRKKGSGQAWRIL